MIKYLVYYRENGIIKRHHHDTFAGASGTATALSNSVKCYIQATIVYDCGSEHTGSLYHYEAPQKRRLLNPGFLDILLKHEQTNKGE